MTKAKIQLDSYQLSISLFNKTKSFERNLRSSLGRRLENISLDSLRDIHIACYSKGEERLARLKNASNKIDEMKILIQMAYDLKGMNIGTLNDLISLTNEIGKQTGFMMKSEKYEMRNKR